MANTPLVFDAPSSMSLEVELYQLGSDVLAGGNTATERTNNKGTYEASITGALNGWYHTLVKDSGSNVIAKYVVWLQDDTNEHYCQEPFSVIPGNSGGLPIVDGNNYIAGIQGTINTFDELNTQLSVDHGYGAWTPGSVGTGARNLTVTVNDGTNLLEGAAVRVTKGAESYVLYTTTTGQVTHTIDDGTWTLSVTLSGYSGHSEQVIVSGDKSVTVSLTQVSVTPSDPGFVTGYSYCYDESGNVEQGVTVYCKAVSLTGVGMIGDSTVRSATSDSNGKVEFTNLQAGATYKFRRGGGSWVQITIPASATSTYELPSFIGEGTS